MFLQNTVKGFFWYKLGIYATNRHFLHNFVYSLETWHPCYIMLGGKSRVFVIFLNICFLLIFAHGAKHVFSWRIMVIFKFYLLLQFLSYNILQESVSILCDKSNEETFLVFWHIFSLKMLNFFLIFWPRKNFYKKSEKSLHYFIPKGLVKFGTKFQACSIKSEGGDFRGGPIGRWWNDAKMTMMLNDNDDKWFYQFMGLSMCPYSNSQKCQKLQTQLIWLLFI